MKIMIISDLAPPIRGGAENYVINLGSRLVELGHEVHWLTSRIFDTPQHEFLNGINIHRVPILYPNRPFFPGRQSFSLTSLMPAIRLARKMDIIQANSLVAGFLGWFIAKYAGKPSILFCHELFGELWKTIGQNPFEKYWYPLFEKFMARAPYDWFACPSEYSRTTLMKQGTSKDRITVIPHGINFTKFDSDTETYRGNLNLEGAFTVGYIGRLNINKTTQAKNIQMLLRAFKLVSREVSNSKLILGGSGFEQLLPIIHDLNIQENVVYVGEVPYGGVQKFYRTCDVAVCPSLSDGFCFMLAEASAYGVPTVATNLGSHPERIINEETGFLSSATEESLARNIIKLNDGKMKENFGKNAKEFVKPLTWEKSVQTHINLYTDVIQRRIK